MAIILEKGGDTHRINLEKPSGRPLTGEIVINLDWNKGGFFKNLFGNAVDLDLGCFYEMRDGKKMLIDGLQFSHGRGGDARSCDTARLLRPRTLHLASGR